MNNNFIVPNFFIVGAPKCGTTALASYLIEHREIFLPKIKEPHYFAFDLAHYRSVSNFEDYKRLFVARSKCHKRVGEASVLYLFSRVAIKNINDFNPSARIIAMLRNPVDLLCSLHSQLLYSFHETVEDFRTAWNLQDVRSEGRMLPPRCSVPELLQYRKTAMLGEQSERLLAYFDPQQVKFLLFDDFKNDTRKVYNEVLSFLEVSQDNRLNFPIINSNKAHRSYLIARALQKRNNKPAPWLVRLDKRLSKIPYARNLHLKEMLLRLNLNTRERRPLDPRFRKELLEIFRSDIEKLSKIIGRNLTQWLKLALFCYLGRALG